jgi:hypothetical protein
MSNNRGMKNIAVATLAALALVLPAAAADISGSWTITGDVVGNAISMKCVFKQADAKVTGTCTYQGLGESPTTGDVSGDKVTFQNRVQRDQTYDLAFSGTLDPAGISIRGEIAVAGVSGSFSGTRDKEPPTISGTWTVAGDVVGNTISMKCVLKQEDVKVTGACTYQGLGDAPTAGDIAGDKVTFENKIQREQLYDLTYYGTLDSTGTSMKGEIAVAGVTGNFTATKDK